MNPFHVALAEIMEARGLEQLELAVLADISQTSVSLYLGQKRRPTPGTIAKVARALGLDPDYFIEYRRWHLHRMLDEWIEADESQVELMLDRWRTLRDRQ